MNLETKTLKVDAVEGANIRITQKSYEVGVPDQAVTIPGDQAISIALAILESTGLADGAADEVGVIPVYSYSPNHYPTNQDMYVYNADGMIGISFAGDPLCVLSPSMALRLRNCISHELCAVLSELVPQHKSVRQYGVDVSQQ
jgi:hypothetical protein